MSDGEPPRRTTDDCDFSTTTNSFEIEVPSYHQKKFLFVRRLPLPSLKSLSRICALLNNMLGLLGPFMDAIRRWMENAVVTRVSGLSFVSHGEIYLPQPPNKPAQ